MPKIKDVITKNPPIAVEKSLLEVISRNPKFIWSTSLEDLEELVCWIMAPGSNSIPDIEETYPADHAVTLNSRYKVSVYRPLPGPLRYLETPTLRTVRDTLLDLHKKDLVWKFELHGRDYFASMKKRDKIIKTVGNKDKLEYWWDWGPKMPKTMIPDSPKK